MPDYLKSTGNLLTMLGGLMDPVRDFPDLVPIRNRGKTIKSPIRTKRPETVFLICIWKRAFSLTNAQFVLLVPNELLLRYVSGKKKGKNKELQKVAEVPPAKAAEPEGKKRKASAEAAEKVKDEEAAVQETKRTRSGEGKSPKKKKRKSLLILSNFE